MTQLLAHISQNSAGDWHIQSLNDHATGVANLAAKFAAEFGMSAFGLELGMLHDEGKRRTNFQNYLKRASGFDPSAPFNSDHTHAAIGAHTARATYPFLSDIIAAAIAGHHAGLYDYDELNSILGRQIPSDYTTAKHDAHTDNLMADLERLKSALQSSRFQHFHHLVRMLFSCLVDADYLDTERAMTPDEFALRGQGKSLQQLQQLLHNHLAQLTSSASQLPVNRIRAQVQQQCIAAASTKPGFFSLTVPTGGGKTLASVLWAIDHAVANNLHRIIIAIPYTSIIIQTAAVLKRIFGEENVLEHHSNFDPGDDRKAKLATENWDYPIVVTTNVQLFESMMSNRPAACRKLHNIARSVLILDEVQTLPTTHLKPIVQCLKAYQSMFGASVLFTTASQPVLSGSISCGDHRSEFKAIEHITEIIPAQWNLHHRLRRVAIEHIAAPLSYDELTHQLVQHPRVLCIVNTRRDAKAIFDRLSQSHDAITMHLSRMMCPRHLEATIAAMKQALADPNQPIRVVSTQLIEAGVDIDFPVVFRQEAGLDSVLQSAGRCNREGRLAQGITHVFSLSDVTLPKGQISRANDARLSLPTDADYFDPQVISEYFRQLYARCNNFDCKDIAAMLNKPGQICFETAAKEFQLIDDNSVDVIVNYDNSPELVDQLRRFGASYSLMKKLARLSVSVSRYNLDQLLNEHIVAEILPGIYYAENPAQYSQQCGLLPDNQLLNEILIC